MRMVKDDICQTEHICVLLVFSSLLFTLATNEDAVKLFVERWNSKYFIVSKSIYMEEIKQWLIQDYKNSHCRIWIRKLQACVKRIFSSFM